MGSRRAMDYRVLLPLRFPSLWPIKSAMDVILPRLVLIPTVIRRDNRSNLTKGRRTRATRTRKSIGSAVAAISFPHQCPIPFDSFFTAGSKKICIRRKMAAGKPAPPGSHPSVVSRAAFCPCIFACRAAFKIFQRSLCSPGDRRNISSREFS